MEAEERSIFLHIFFYQLWRLEIRRESQFLKPEIIPKKINIDLLGYIHGDCHLSIFTYSLHDSFQIYRCHLSLTIIFYISLTFIYLFQSFNLDFFFLKSLKNIFILREKIYDW